MKQIINKVVCYFIGHKYNQICTLGNSPKDQIPYILGYRYKCTRCNKCKNEYINKRMKKLEYE